MTPPDKTFPQRLREAGAAGPRNAAEHHLYALIMVGLASGPGTEYASVADFGAELHARLRARRRQS
ncbi:hypothetical protein [Ralstonia pseudosolanacearum]|uniref:Uncharacterized protein n=1 Tax=Ralstonia solanacearum TaxID=305 RepID=A0AA92IE03_RALSL|nr:hypothetical protein [Ralstonia pseudosolanacearum]QCX49365.1 hypothetical protein E7Z57_09765 [Ralstonia pseudosolanacearum]